MNKQLILLLTLIVLALLYQQRVSHSALSEPQNNEPPASGSLMFIENVGQFAPEVRFVVDGPLGQLTLTDDALWLTIVEPLTEQELEKLLISGEEGRGLLKKQGVHLRLTFVGANQKVQFEPFAPLKTRLSYFHGNEPAQWRTDVPVWEGVRLKNLYPGIDLELTSQQARFVQRLLVEGESKSSLARVGLSVEGAESLSLEPNQLLLNTALGTFAYPLFELKGTDASAHLQGNMIVAPFYEPTAKSKSSSSISPQELPSNLLYATFLGGSSTDSGYDMALSKNGEVYLQGYTQSADLPLTPGAFDVEYEDGIGNTSELYIAKLLPEASQLEYLTYIGGGGDEYGTRIAIDGSGAVYITGKTYSPDFPNTPQNLGPYAGQGDGFVLKLDPSGATLNYATYLGGEGDETSYAIAVSEEGAAVVTGWTASLSFPVTENAWDNTLNPTTCSIYNCYDVFVAKLEPNGEALSYATYLGGEKADYSRAITIDQSGAVYVTGYTRSTDFPTTQDVYSSSYIGRRDIFVTKIAPLGDYLIYSTFLGASRAEEPRAMVGDSEGNLYITGWTQSPDFPMTATAFDTTCGTDGKCNPPNNGSLTDDTDAFVIKLDATGSTVLLGSFLGGTLFDEALDLTLDSSGSIYITGRTESFDFPTTSGAFQRERQDTFLVKLNSSGSRLEHSTFFGGTSYARGLAVSEEGVVYLTGVTHEADLPITPDAFDNTCGTDGTCNYSPNSGLRQADAFFAKMVLPEAAITHTIPISGALLATEQISYTFASDTFTETVVLTHAPRHRLSLPETGDLVPMRFFANLAQGSNQLLQPTQPYSLTLSYTSQELGTIISETLSLYYWDGSQWVKENSVLDPDAHTLSATPEQLGWWALLGETHRTFLPLLQR